MVKNGLMGFGVMCAVWVGGCAMEGDDSGLTETGQLGSASQEIRAGLALVRSCCIRI